MSTPVQSLERRFHVKYAKQPNDGCWLWTGSKHTTGYGGIRFRGRMWGAHRVSWTLYRGEIPEGLSVCHTCDNPLCVNPDHLFLGNQKDNMLDARNKGRLQNMKGTANHNSKLTEDDVRAIRADPRPQKTIATEYKVSASQVSRIVTRRNWVNLP